MKAEEEKKEVKRTPFEIAMDYFKKDYILSMKKEAFVKKHGKYVAFKRAHITAEELYDQLKKQAV